MRIKKFALLFCCFIVLLFLFPSPVLANNDNDNCWRECAEEITEIGGKPVTPFKVATLQCLECIFMKVLNIATSLAGLAVFIMLVVGGFKYLTSGGDPKKAQSAKDTLTYAILGLVLVIAAWFILQFIEEFTGVKVTIFKIPGAD